MNLKEILRILSKFPICYINTAIDWRTDNFIFVLVLKDVDIPNIVLEKIILYKDDDKIHCDVNIPPEQFPIFTEIFGWEVEVRVPERGDPISPYIDAKLYENKLRIDMVMHPGVYDRIVPILEKLAREEKITLIQGRYALY